DREPGREDQRPGDPGGGQRFPEDEGTAERDQERGDAPGDRVGERQFAAPVCGRQEREVGGLGRTGGQRRRPGVHGRVGDGGGQQEPGSHGRAHGGGGHPVGGPVQHPVPGGVEQRRRENQGKRDSAHRGTAGSVPWSMVIPSP